jgi:hypothetical protein
MLEAGTLQHQFERIRHGNAFGTLDRHKEHRDFPAPVRVLARACGDDQHGHDRTIGHPHLLSVDDVVAPDAARIGLHAARVAAAVRFRDADFGNYLARGELRQPFVLLRFRAGVIDGVCRRIGGDAGLHPGTTGRKSVLFV